MKKEVEYKHKIELKEIELEHKNKLELMKKEKEELISIIEIYKKMENK